MRECIPSAGVIVMRLLRVQARPYLQGERQLQRRQSYGANDISGQGIRGDLYIEIRPGV